MAQEGGVTIDARTLRVTDTVSLRVSADGALQVSVPTAFIPVRDVSAVELSLRMPQALRVTDTVSLRVSADAAIRIGDLDVWQPAASAILPTMVLDQRRTGAAGESWAGALSMEIVRSRLADVVEQIVIGIPTSVRLLDSEDRVLWLGDIDPSSLAWRQESPTIEIVQIRALDLLARLRGVVATTDIAIRGATLRDAMTTILTAAGVATADQLVPTEVSETGVWGRVVEGDPLVPALGRMLWERGWLLVARGSVITARRWYLTGAPYATPISRVSAASGRTARMPVRLVQLSWSEVAAVGLSVTVSPPGAPGSPWPSEPKDFAYDTESSAVGEVYYVDPSTGVIDGLPASWTADVTWHIDRVTVQISTISANPDTLSALTLSVTADAQWLDHEISIETEAEVGDIETVTTALTTQTEAENLARAIAEDSRALELTCNWVGPGGAPDLGDMVSVQALAEDRPWMVWGRRDYPRLATRDLPSQLTLRQIPVIS